MGIEANIQTPSPGKLVVLYEVDTSPIGGTQRFYFSNESELITFNGIIYKPIPCEVEDFENSLDGALPAPSIIISNLTFAFSGVNITYEGLVGAKFIRRKTFEKYLDGQSEANPAEVITDVWWIDEYAEVNKHVKYTLKSILDFGKRKSPPRQCTPYCSHTYRYYNTATSSFTVGTCPYTGSNYFDSTGTACDIEDDACGKTLFHCKLRYSSPSQTLPFKGFPSMRY